MLNMDNDILFAIFVKNYKTCDYDALPYNIGSGLI